MKNLNTNIKKSFFSGLIHSMIVGFIISSYFYFSSPKEQSFVTTAANPIDNSMIFYNINDRLLTIYSEVKIGFNNIQSDFNVMQKTNVEEFNNIKSSQYILLEELKKSTVKQDNIKTQPNFSIGKKPIE